MQSSNCFSQKRIWILLFTIFLLTICLTACGTDEPIVEEPAPVMEEAPAEEPSAIPITPITSSEEGTWLVMLYQDADDETLEKDIFIDLNEAEVVGSTEKVTIVAQIDRLDGGYDGGGDFTSTKRFLITQDQDNDLETITSEELADLGEVDMGDAQSLVDFAVWAIQNYPAEHYVLILSDHGMGWLGGWTDNDPNVESQMTMNDIDQALADILQQTGIGQFELVGFDACLMAQLEVFSAIAPHARYAVASAETEPALGWAYAAFLGSLAENPAMSGADLAKEIVNTYIGQDFRIIDDQARGVLLEENFGYEGESTAEEAAEVMSQDVTLTAVDLSQMKPLIVAWNEFALTLAGDDPQVAATARAYAQSYEDVFGKDEEPSYFDVGHFAAIVSEESDNEEVKAAAQSLLDAMQDAILAEKHGEGRPGATGFSFYFPNAELFEFTSGSALNYGAGASRFSTASLWDEFLSAYYVGLTDLMDLNQVDLNILDPAFPVLPPAEAIEIPAGTKPTAPAAGGLTVEPLQISANEIPADGTLTISTNVSGANIAYLYLYTLYYNEEDGSYLIADISYLEADSVKKVNGVTYPDWGKGDIPIELAWEPTVYYMSDGNEAHDQFALFEPQTYGPREEETEYVVYGIYTSQSGKSWEAKMVFDGNGQMRSLWAFSGSNETSAPRQVFPKPGDTFTIWEQWLEFDDAAQDWTYIYYEGGVMTFGSQPFTIQPYYAFPGLYQVGIVAEDFDGNLVEEYIKVTVRE